ncbi:MAG: sensor histidine kinase, partial [Proteobacteria bacterium]|nr:sensor histidine kinase [Burkholderiales bacterium]
LVREVHHRIKNHLQGVTGLIERYRHEHPGLDSALDAISGQLQSIGTVYGLLARSGRSDLALDEIAQAVTDGVRGIAPAGISSNFPDGISAWRIAEQYCVPIALIVNELVMNAIKHGVARADNASARVGCTMIPEGCMLCIVNAGTLPPGFDFHSGAGIRTGLRLVRTMLPAQGASLTFRSRSGEVDVALRLEPPVLVPLTLGDAV